MRSRFLAAGMLAAVAAARLEAGTISGRVLGPDGSPVANAPVWTYAFRTPVEAWADATAGASPKALNQARTDADGRFQAAVDPSGPPVRLRIEPPNLPGVALDGPFDPAETVRLPDLTLPESSPLSGSVVGPDGKPVAAARVRVDQGFGGDRDGVAFFAETTAGPDGAFRLAAAPGPARTVWVRASGWAPAMRIARSSPDALRIVLERGGSISGTVVDPAGRPAAHALVRTLVIAAPTDAAGRYRLDGVPAGAARVEAIASANLVARRGGLRVAAGATVAADLRLERGAEIAGTAVDSLTRRPIAGARISVDEARSGNAISADPLAIARTDSRGRFSIGSLFAGDYEVRAERVGYLAATLPRVAASAGAAPAAAPLALVPAASISGRVVDPQGKPVRGASVALEARGGRGRFGGPGGFRDARRGAAQTAPDGSFRLDGLAAVTSGAPLVATHAGFAPAEKPGVTLKAGQSLTGVVLTLAPGLAAKGRVVDEASQPVAGAEIRVSASSDGRGGRRFFRPPDASSAPAAVSAADGTFTVAGLAAGAWDVTATHAGFSPKTSSALPLPAKASSGWPPIVLVRGAAVAGVVHDEQGAPIVGAMVTVAGEGIAPDQTTTDGAGNFRVADLGKGRPLMLLTSAPGYGFASRSVTPPAEGVTVVLGKSGTIRGRVVDASTGEPVMAFSIGTTPSARGRRGPGAGGFGGGGFGGGGAQPQYAEDGSFEVSVAPGTWNVRASADGYRPADVANVELAAGETKEGVEIALNRGGGIAGRVVDPRGNPVSGASVSCCDAGARAGGPGGFGGGGSGPSATSDGDGRFQLDGLPDGHVTLTVTDADYVPTTRDADPAATGDLVIMLSAGAEISGAVLSSDSGTPAAGASVRLDPQGDSGGVAGASQTGQADAGGGFRFDHLSAGRYRLTAQTKTASSAPQDVVLADGQQDDGVQLTIATGTEVDGAVTGLPAGQLGGVNVSASATGFQSSTVTSDDGRFTLMSVPPGVVRISAATTMPSVRTVAKTVEISGDDTQTSVELAFDGGSRLSGTVTQAGQPVSQFSISAAPDPPDGTGRRYSAMSDGSGHYAIENMTDGDYQVSVLAGSSPYRVTVSVSGDTNGDIAMPGSTLTGFVTDSASGQPLDGASITAQTGAEATSQSIHRTTTDSTGAYTLSGFDPGNYQVSARKDGYQLKTESATVGSDPVTLDFALDSGSGLSIQASDGLTGTPLGGIVALAFGAGGAVAFQGSVSLDSSGLGQIPSLPPGAYAVYVFSSGYAPHALPSVTVPSPPVSVALTPGGRVEARGSAVQYGRIVDGSGNPVLLSAFRLDGSVTVAPPVSVWEHLPPGSFTFVVPGANGAAAASYPFTVAEGQTTRLALP